MKHTLKRLICMISVIVLLAVLLPTAALAAPYYVGVYSELYSTAKAEEEALIGNSSYTPDCIPVAEKPVKISVADFKKFITEDDVVYKILGINSFSTWSPKASLEIPAVPEEGTPEYEDWQREYGNVYLAYGPHVHESEVWIFDKNNHWQYCDECGARFNMDWHHDYDENSACDECGNPIHYYTITVKEMTGGTVTVSQDTAVLNDRVEVTVTPDAGYVLKEIRFYNLNDMHSQLVRYEDVAGSEYHFIVLPWDIEIEADFVKAG